LEHDIPHFVQSDHTRTDCERTYFL
jgi:hypothetical protein